MSQNEYETTQEILLDLFDMMFVIEEIEDNYSNLLDEEKTSIHQYTEEELKEIGEKFIQVYATMSSPNDTHPDCFSNFLIKIREIIYYLFGAHPSSKLEFIRDNGNVFDVDDDLENIMFPDIEDEPECREKKINQFIEDAMRVITFRGINDFNDIDMNLENWVVLDNHKVGFYLDEHMYHHYGVWIPQKHLGMLNLPRIIENNEVYNLELFYVKKTYRGQLVFADGNYYLCWEGSLRRRINQKFPDSFSDEDSFAPDHRVLMTFLFHENFKKGFVKIGFEIKQI